jgi:hypothetical protein
MRSQIILLGITPNASGAGVMHRHQLLRQRHRALLTLPLALPAACSVLSRFQTVEGLTPGRQHGTMAIGVRELS